MRFIYCIKGNYLFPCDKPKKNEEYYIFEYTKDLQLLISKCKGEHCNEIEVQCLNLKFDLLEALVVEEELNKLSAFRSFLQKYNAKVYFLENNSVLEAIVNPKLFYYKYLGINDNEIRMKTINELKRWVSRFLFLVNILEDLKVIRFTSHLDSLDGRYALWIKENCEDPAFTLVTEKEGEIKIWLGYKDCDILIRNRDERCYKINQ
ncbi:hypothetical protein SJAV_10130 [Sulfurisphaera javensis]|uniref:Uncharacterized protein n=1 Tax=Sulfurisphaera javensis TaxID=2049879 RepID=A0AAT9GQH5_9CREN